MPTACEPCPGKTSANFVICFSLRLPADEHRAPREASTHAFEQNVMTRTDTAIADGLVQRERHGGRGGVRVPIDCRDHALHAEAQLLCGRLDNANVCLMGNQ